MKPTPTQIEAAARAIVNAKSPETASDEWWQKNLDHYLEMCAEFPAYANAHSLITDAFRDAEAALSAALSVQPEEAVVGEVVASAALQTAIYRLCLIEASPNLKEGEKSLLREWITELRAAAPSTPEGWQSIDSAPENVAILIHVPHLDYYGNNGVYAGMLVNMGTGRRWMTFGHAIGRDLGPDCMPDAWMPMPSYSSDKGSEKEMNRIIEGAQEALKIAKGEQPAASITVNGHKYVPADTIEALRRELADTRRNALMEAAGIARSAASNLVSGSLSRSIAIALATAIEAKAAEGEGR